MKRKIYKSIVTLGLLLGLTVGLLAGCNESSESSAGKSSALTQEVNGKADGGVTNLEGYPITTKPITIKAAVMYNSLRPDMDKSVIWKYVSEKTNINLEIEVVKDQDKADLMFASGDFPDLLMGVNINANQMTNSVDGGYFVEIEPLLEKYAPTWNRFMKENRLVYNASLATNGKLYGLPYIDFAPYDRNIRDQWIIMKSWLSELNLEIPKTTADFKKALEAIKANAGKGTIPADVIPYYFLYDSYVGGQFDIYGSFGVYITSGDYVVVEDGKVKDQSTNPAIKEPLKYLRDLYAEGLIPPEIFTDDWNTYASKIGSDPPIVGSYHSYANRQLDVGSAMGPLDSGNGTKPLLRSQAYVPGPANAAIITKTNKYPVATVRLLEAIASDTDMLLNVSRGAKGIVWDYDNEGKAYQLFWEESPEKMAANSKYLGMHNSFVALKDQTFYDKVWKEITYDQVNSRGWAYQHVYKDAVMPNDMIYVEGALSQDDNNLLNQYRTDLGNYRKAMFADFITGKRDIDSNWDAYVKQMHKLGLESFIQLKQKAYDMMVK
ncbi:hypothetical protein BK138_29760 [Paenibacillus rhizosphaerae]|uniref:ABC transporter substrate-binding protein n=1 Tax=Paenibacillus rhizosphaerae TaxID=297318 RepID=A0A1R1EC57_9BACL|nr:hypothetical protein [Paenibacillus rhizosphaerae]OMF49395.1 hypothetical protein BK138_29760 [Paenibacillus rhizosphaerae]